MKDQEFKDRYIALKRKMIDLDAAMRAAQAEQKALADRWAEEKAAMASFGGLRKGGIYKDMRGVGSQVDEPGLVKVTDIIAMIALSEGMAGKSDTRGEWDYQAEVYVRYRHQTKAGAWSAKESLLPLSVAKNIFKAFDV